MSRAAWALLALGLAQMLGDLSGLRVLKGAALATAASPAPKVFSAVRGFETFSVGYVLSWRQDGRRVTQAIDSKMYARLPGPYNLRNVYGAVLAYGPVLPDRLRLPVSEYAFCGARPALQRLGIDTANVQDPIIIFYRPRPGTPTGDWPLSIEVQCP